MNHTSVAFDDCLKVTASGFIHLRILCERLEYLYGVLSVTPIVQERVAGRIADYIERENRWDGLGGSQMAQCVQEFLAYLTVEYARLKQAFPEFGSERAGARFVIEQIQSAVDYFRNPNSGGRRQANVLDE